MEHELDLRDENLFQTSAAYGGFLKLYGEPSEWFEYAEENLKGNEFDVFITVANSLLAWKSDFDEYKKTKDGVTV